jgi:hypothetical protein
MSKIGHTEVTQRPENSLPNRRSELVRWSKRISLDVKGELSHLKREWAVLRKRLPGVKDPWSWKKFHHDIRSEGCNLLVGLQRFPDSILIAGCQRSGTTILARLISESDGMVNYRTRDDDELDAALILCGHELPSLEGRYCFQTTYLNECYREYLNESYRYKLVWVLRNPYSVVCSMRYNWDRFAFNELFDACGYPLLTEEEKRRHDRYGPISTSRIYRACLAYVGKELQAVELTRHLSDSKFMVVDYDDLVQNKSQLLSRIFEFIELPYKSRYAEKIHGRSLRKSDWLTKRERKRIGELCVPVYENLKSLAVRA